MRGRRDRTVWFRLQPPRPVAFADLRGDLVHWRHPVPLARGAGGALEARVDVPPGVYAYKYQLDDGTWLLDPDNPRTRSIDGVQNSLLVVEGAAEPLLHAPAPPWVTRTDDGRLCVRAGLRRPANALSIAWDEGHGERAAPMHPVCEEDEHVVFEVTLPASARRVRYVLLLPDGRRLGAVGGAGQAFEVAPADLDVPAPAWWREAVVYTIFVDRFRRGGGELSPASADERARLGGDLRGVEEALPYLTDLGVTVLHLTPVATAPSAHRYDAIDPRAVDPALGGEAALASLLSAAHRAGLRVLLDVPVTHVHRDFAPFLDVRRRGPASPYWPWFRAHRFPFAEGFDPGYEHYQKGQWQEPLLETDEPAVVEYLAGTVAALARLGADGFRIDAAADAPIALVRRLREAARAVRPDAVVFGEIIPDNLWRWTSGALDAATDFAASEVLREWVLGRVPAERAARVLERRRIARGGAGFRGIAMTASHDQPRLLSLSGDAALARLGHLLLLVRPEVPALYYGDEVGLRGPGERRDFEDAWPDRAPMPWSPEHRDVATLELFRRAIALRRARPSLHRGEAHELPVPGQPDVLVLRRSLHDEHTDVLLHRGEGTVRVPLPPGAPAGAELLLGLGDVAIEGGVVCLGPRSGAVIARALPPEVRADLAEVRAEARLLATLDYQRGALQTLALPSQLYVTVTEACNLRCAHCITHAPGRTAAGTARELRPWVLDALAEPLAAADYLGLSHGGEALTSPRLFDLLGTLRRARDCRPGRADVHLLTNGTLLTGEVTARLVEAGVTSLAVSIDGATPATNDPIRLGSRLGGILENVRAALETRARLGADLRLGLSVVLTARNAGELGALGRLARQLGVDWVKLEEMFPATQLAREELVLPRAPAAQAGLEALRGALAGSAVVLVDHLSPPGGCACDADAAAFRAADDFANRMALRPCRAPWEVACIDPDGTVHAVGYDAPALGNLAEAPMLTLWNGPVAVEQRRAALASRSAPRRAACAHVA